MIHPKSHRAKLVRRVASISSPPELKLAKGKRKFKDPKVKDISTPSANKVLYYYPLWSINMRDRSQDGMAVYVTIGDKGLTIDDITEQLADEITEGYRYRQRPERSEVKEDNTVEDAVFVYDKQSLNDYITDIKQGLENPPQDYIYMGYDTLRKVTVGNNDLTELIGSIKDKMNITSDGDVYISDKLMDILNQGD